MSALATRLLLLLPLLLTLAACQSDAASSAQPTEARTQPIGPPAPELVGITGWINSDPLTLAALRDENRVVLLDVWTYTCINCIRTLPYVRDWHAKYADRGLTIIGVHTPEFAFEHDRDNVIQAAERLGVRYPIAQDNDWQTWRALDNHYWPAQYLVGVDGLIRYQHVGEGRYDEIERQIRDALTQAGHEVSDIPVGGVDPSPNG